MRKLLSFFAGHKLLFIPLVAVVGVGTYIATRPPKAPSFETAVVSRGNIVQDVSVTGHVDPENEIDLSFERAGNVATEPRQVGDHVKQGDVLVRLDASELEALRLGAKANVDLELANLAALKKGSRPEDIAVSEAQVESAQSAYNDALTALTASMASAYTAANDALYNKTDHFLDNPRTIHPLVNFPITDAKLGIDIETARVALETMFATWVSERADTSADTVSKASLTEAHLKQLKSYLDVLASAVNAVTVSSSVTETTLDAWKLDVSTARTNVNAAITALVTAESTANSARSALDVAKDQLTLKQAGPTEEAIAAEEAKVAAMKATLANYDAQIAKMTIVAPFAGVVTREDAKKGQSITPNVPLVTLQNDSHFKIVANVTEADIAKVKVGDPATITFDAYGSDVVFNAKVALIDPAETVIEGVSTYKVTLYLDQDDNRIRPGMTANIDIATDKRENVIYVPARSVTGENGKKVVRVLVPGQATTTAVEVVTGMRGSDGNIEIVSGLHEGDKVVTLGF